MVPIKTLKELSSLSTSSDAETKINNMYLTYS